jgi:hypothetical protein
LRNLVRKNPARSPARPRGEGAGGPEERVFTSGSLKNIAPRGRGPEGREEGPGKARKKTGQKENYASAFLNMLKYQCSNAPAARRAAERVSRRRNPAGAPDKKRRKDLLKEYLKLAKDFVDRVPDLVLY